MYCFQLLYGALRYPIVTTNLRVRAGERKLLLNPVINL